MRREAQSFITDQVNVGDRNVQLTSNTSMEGWWIVQQIVRPVLQIFLTTLQVEIQADSVQEGLSIFVLLGTARCTFKDSRSISLWLMKIKSKA